jgi:hypothetical protein
MDAPTTAPLVNKYDPTPIPSKQTRDEENAA